ncbi:MAG TPA: hypothetical protein PLY70_11015 [Saprospiraceae bacterium]|nr:hypothetical protein [Saprospiraceae bacterium]HPN70331.1 hypothetical protein [Saprospiraceae bacterium]
MDDNLFDKLKSLFNKSQKIAPSRPTIHEEWKLEEFLVDIERRELDAVRSFCGQILDQYKFWKLGLSVKDQFYFMNNDKISAIAFDCKPKAFDHIQSMKFISVVGNKIKEMNYIIKLADVMTRSRDENIETIYKIYLKPSHRLQIEEKAKQLYGNLQIEYLLINNKPMRISLKASKYSDQNYAEALPFEQLLEMLS